jgi:hypothetical protein
MKTKQQRKEGIKKRIKKSMGTKPEKETQAQ